MQRSIRCNLPHFHLHRQWQEQRICLQNWTSVTDKIDKALNSHSKNQGPGYCGRWEVDVQTTPTRLLIGLLWWSCSWGELTGGRCILMEGIHHLLSRRQDQSSERQNEGKASLSFFHYFKQAATPTFNHSVCSMYRISMVKVGYRKLRKSDTHRGWIFFSFLWLRCRSGVVILFAIFPAKAEIPLGKDSPNTNKQFSDTE